MQEKKEKTRDNKTCVDGEQHTFTKLCSEQMKEGNAATGT